MNLASIAEQTNLIIAVSKINFPYLMMFMAALWAFNIMNWYVFNSFFNRFGIYPRHIVGIPGIFLSPFLHGDFNHLFFNSIPLVALANFVLLQGVSQFVEVTLYIVVGSGILVWLFGRRGIHIGASSLIMGYWSYLIGYAYYYQSGVTIIVAIITLYYFGGLFLGLFPSEEKVSWEGHLMGFLAGIFAIFMVSAIN